MGGASGTAPAVPIQQKIYETAIRNGFSGTYDEWCIHIHGHCRKYGGMLIRFTGLLPANTTPSSGPLTTLDLKKVLERDQYLIFPAATRAREITRMLLFNGRKIGAATLRLPRGMEERLCPYFDPVRRSLQFRTHDGQDAPYSMDAFYLAQYVQHRPILLLAHAEGLLAKVPGA